MSTELANLVESIKLLNTLQPRAVHVDYAWRKLYNAEKYLQKQVAPLFAE